MLEVFLSRCQNQRLFQEPRIFRNCAGRADFAISASGQAQLTRHYAAAIIHLPVMNAEADLNREDRILDRTCHSASLLTSGNIALHLRLCKLLVLQAKFKNVI
jgi:hypothetical protein